jgi:hypothetical protein
MVLAVSVLGFAPESHADDLPALQVEQLPPGSGWWCYSFALTKGVDAYSSSACFRAKARCSAAAADDRRALLAGVTIAPGAFTCSGAERVTALTARAVVHDDVVHRQFLQLEHCLEARRSFQSADYDQVSRCSAVGDLAGTQFRRDLIPAGNSWFCGAVTLASGATSLCRRTREDCTALLARFKRAGTRVGACVPQPSAFALTASPDQIWVFGSEELCRTAAEDISEASPCVKVSGSIAVPAPSSRLARGAAIPRH